MFWSGVLSNLPVTLIIIIIIIICPAVAQQSFKYSCSGSGNYTANSTYKSNLRRLLSSLPTDNRLDHGFLNISYGKSPHRVNAIALCRGDLKPAACRSCLTDSVSNLPPSCPTQKEAVIWYPNCMLRYSDRRIFGVVQNDPTFWLRNIQDAADLQQFNQVVQTMLAELSRDAAAGGSRLKFAAGNVTTRDSGNLYATVQCTPDMSYSQCSDCLQTAAGLVQAWCLGKVGVRILRPNCNIRYEVYSFFDSTAVTRAFPSPLPPPPPPPLLPLSPPSASPDPTANAEGNKSKTSKTVLIIVLPIVVVVIVMVLLVNIFIILRARRRNNGVESVVVDDDTADLETSVFDISTIRAATDDFSDANIIGRGGFGAVYKGRLVNGQDIAVKRQSQSSMQGESEFKNEVLLVAKLQHRNLVRFLGFCLDEKERLLVYEFVQNSSLDKFIFDPFKRPSLDWSMRYKIIGGIARGLVYLHEDSQVRIIHRDLKAINILLDTEMNPKISDFGMAKLFQQDQTQEDMGRIVGTNGYMAPEYAMHGKFSVKSDVFSFGILVLEIVSGEKNNSFQQGENPDDLLSYAWKNWSAGTPLNVVDPIIRGGSSCEMKKCINIGLLCAQENSADRPTMETVLLMLSGGDSVILPILSPPADLKNKSPQSDVSSQGRSNSHVIEIK
ncbi:cysteine-rich receptor-like protein kinase 10 [Momordica charantia]|uniref:Cysteine-rich receptor-like protein kinase 10 n=1 Tax=Momordica charantia TaxID=3673 RepID=A0A6J1CEN5_MOMCH|nr:cysteine-rich receptor-like protein kinase 10 [Momordica charantia]